jgi:biotin operon repressor
LAFIDIDQFLDSTYKLGGDRRILSLETFTTVLGLSKNTVRKCIKDLEDKGIHLFFQKQNRHFLRFQYSQITNQIPNHNLLIHFSTGPLPFREGFYNKSHHARRKRISNISNITALVKETGVRRALNLILEDLDSKGYLLDSAIGEGTDPRRV